MNAQLAQVIDQMGLASASAQGLPQPITSLGKL